jgi:four helix bundle protein
MGYGDGPTGDEGPNSGVCIADHPTCECTAARAHRRRHWKQLIRCGTSVGANYRAVCRARTKPDFLNKLGIVEEEADETDYWLGLLSDSGLVKRDLLSD